MTDAEMDRMFEATFSKEAFAGRAKAFKRFAALAPGLTIRKGNPANGLQTALYLGLPWASKLIREVFAAWAGQLQPIKWWADRI